MARAERARRERPSVLTMRGASVRYGGTRALDDASLELVGGEIHALMGENGAGKSTVIRVLAGLVRPDAVELRLDGVPIRLDIPRDAARHGFRFIHQELDVVPALTVAENIALGRPWPRRFGVAIDRAALHRDARVALERLGAVHVDPRRRVGRLATGDRLLVAIAAALAGGGAPRLYVMDEPTAALNAAESERLFGVVRELARQGAAILWVSHRMDEVMALCERVTVLRDGRRVDTRRVADTDKPALIRAMTGRTVTGAYPARTDAIGSRVVCELRGLATGPVRDVDVDVRAGEIVGLAALAESGQSEILQCVVGARGPRAGTIRVAGRDGALATAPTEPAAAWARGIASVPRERRREGLLPGRGVTDNVTLPVLGTLSRAGGVLHRRRLLEHATRLAREVRLKAAGMDQRVRELSGGNQQKCLFARAFGSDPVLLALDEPTRGVDVGARADLHALIRARCAGGTAVLLSSSDLDELVGLCDRLVVLRRGRQRDIIDTTNLTPSALAERLHA